MSIFKNLFRFYLYSNYSKNYKLERDAIRMQRYRLQQKQMFILCNAKLSALQGDSHKARKKRASFN